MHVRLTWLSVAAFGLTGLLAGRAAATSCGPSKWDTDQERQYKYLEPELTVPLNGAPWEVISCPDEGTPTAPTCELVRFIDGYSDEDDEEEVSAVTVELVGGESCGLAREELVAPIQHRTYIRRFTPEAPLLEGAIYHARCDEHYLFTFAVRDDSEPAAPPELADPTVHPVDGDSCCGRGDGLGLQVADPEASFLEEGGYIELAYTNGQRFAVTRPKDGESFLVPPTDDIITLTPVAADGTRGEPIELVTTDSDQACSATVRVTPLSLWLLAPFVWICGHRRGRGSSRARASTLRARREDASLPR